MATQMVDHKGKRRSRTEEGRILNAFLFYHIIDKDTWVLLTQRQCCVGRWLGNGDTFEWIIEQMNRSGEAEQDRESKMEKWVPWRDSRFCSWSFPFFDDRKRFCICITECPDSIRCYITRRAKSTFWLEKAYRESLYLIITIKSPQ